MQILVTGGTGFVGSHVCRQLRADGHRVRLLVRSIDKAQSLYRHLGDEIPELVRGDVTEIASVRAALQDCDGVVHAAAGTPLQMESQQQMFAVNVGGVKNVVDSALACGIEHIVCISSITAIFNEDASKVTPDAPPASSSMPYGQSKVAAEHYLRDLQSQGAPVSIVYPGAIIGPDDPGLSDTFKALKHRIENGFRIIDDGGMQHVDVRDLSALICALVVDGSAGRYLLPGVYCQWSELADIVEQVSGCQLQRIAARGWKLRLIGRLIDVVRKFRPVASPISAETMRYATLWPNIENSDELARRGLSLRSTSDTFADAITWMVNAGHLDASRCPGVKPG